MQKTFSTTWRLGAALALALATGAAMAQGTGTGTGTAGDTGSTPRDLPPGATSARGNKAAVPASGASAAINPMTGSTAGKPPGVNTGRADKGETPKGKGTPADGASAPAN